MRIYTGKISDNNGIELSDPLYNPHNVTAEVTEVNPGQYEGVLSAGVLNVNYPKRWYNSNKFGYKYSIVATAANKFLVEVFDMDGDLESGQLEQNLFELHI